MRGFQCQRCGSPTHAANGNAGFYAKGLVVRHKRCDICSMDIITVEVPLQVSPVGLTRDDIVEVITKGVKGGSSF